MLGAVVFLLFVGFSCWLALGGWLHARLWGTQAGLWAQAWS